MVAALFESVWRETERKRETNNNGWLGVIGEITRFASRSVPICFVSISFVCLLFPVGTTVAKVFTTFTRLRTYTRTAVQVRRWVGWWATKLLSPVRLAFAVLVFALIDFHLLAMQISTVHHGHWTRQIEMTRQWCAPIVCNLRFDAFHFSSQSQ